MQKLLLGRSLGKRLVGMSRKPPTVLCRPFSASHFRRSQVDPQDPYAARITKVKRVGTIFPEPISPEIYLSQEPMYMGPMASQVAFSKRWALGLLAVGGYVEYLSMQVTGMSTAAAIICAIPIVAPYPLIQYFAGNYVTRIFRVYRQGEPQTYANLTKNETLMVEKVNFTGRSTYGVPIKVKSTYVVNKRLGWVDWVYVDENGAMCKMYVKDNMGGLKMDRVWGLLEKNTGINNGRAFLDELPGFQNSDYTSEKASPSPETVRSTADQITNSADTDTSV